MNWRSEFEKAEILEFDGTKNADSTAIVVVNLCHYLMTNSIALGINHFHFLGM
jgi:hypothetical protein